MPDAGEREGDPVIMKIAVAADIADPHAQVSRHAARAACYLVFDATGQQVGAIQNPFKDYDRAVGIRVADFLADQGIGIVVAANFGTGFTDALTSKGVRMIVHDGSIAEAGQAAAREVAT
jgi:predicted Fe-Mo cluster-binding NifX family protein